MFMAYSWYSIVHEKSTRLSAIDTTNDIILKYMKKHGRGQKWENLIFYWRTTNNHSKGVFLVKVRFFFKLYQGKINILLKLCSLSERVNNS